MTDTTKLGPCPFCLGEAIRLVSIPTDNPWIFFFGCTRCEANGPVARTQVEAALAWNTRIVLTQTEFDKLGGGVCTDDMESFLRHGWSPEPSELEKG